NYPRNYLWSHFHRFTAPQFVSWLQVMSYKYLFYIPVLCNTTDPLSPALRCKAEIFLSPALRKTK
ncbi:MAG: hypothetical protein OXC48_11235, partial [Endozoicomonadaceae bacterium]|nr:hypothetical protein [Endozoicomonadaceae bacterium]